MRNMNDLVRQAGVMQNKIAKMQQEMAERTVEASSGGGMVKVWKDRSALEKPSEPFNMEKDAQHYDDAPDTSFAVKPGRPPGKRRRTAPASRQKRCPAHRGRGSP